MAQQAIDESGRAVHEGQELTDFRGEKWAFVQVTGRGKIYVRKGNDYREFFPSVFKLSLVPVERNFGPMGD